MLNREEILDEIRQKKQEICRFYCNFVANMYIMRNSYCIWILIAILCATTGRLNAQVTLSAGEKGVENFSMLWNGEQRNFINKGAHLGALRLVYTVSGSEQKVSTEEFTPKVEKSEQSASFFWTLPEGLKVTENFAVEGEEMHWRIRIENATKQEIRLRDAAFSLPVGGINHQLAARYNLNIHACVNQHASYIYWLNYDGQSPALILMPQSKTSLEYATSDGWYYFHSQATQEGFSETKGAPSWYLPATEKTLKAGQKEDFELVFFLAKSQSAVEQAIADHGGINFRVVPGMVVPQGEEVQFALRSRDAVKSVESQNDVRQKVSLSGKKASGFRVAKVTFDQLGVQRLKVCYGQGKTMQLDFFVTEPVETLIRKRATFLTEHQQCKDPSKWYDGLYSLYDMEKDEFLNPDHMGDLRDKYMVGGSDDPSNSKPMFVSEKNVFWPDEKEIASLEYYEEHFVWGKLQRTDKEFPYPYGIYGSDNWHENRSGNYGKYNSGGSGKERMWRTFDYVTHIGIYYNLYRIARENPSMVHYLDAQGYLDRAYHTAMAYFEVPYNIIMGKQWAFHGWCDWAFKQGNFHERYILDLMEALEKEGKQDEADKLRHEWEKKITYMVYEASWPFGSEMFVDRTAFESSYYVAEYALTHEMPVHEQYWYDKNAQRWYSYTEYPQAPKDSFMQNQLDANLSLRGIYETGYWLCGTAWTATEHTLEYMTQMGGVALLDYATRFADDPADYIRYGYNSLLASWALMDTEGRAGWAFCKFNNTPPYMPYLRFNRGPWRFDGEIDHGFTGGLHGQGCYVINDPVFGEIAYGGKLEATPEAWNVTPWDGGRRYVALPQYGRLEMKLLSDGFAAGKPIRLARDASRISFTLEQRGETKEAQLLLKHLPAGHYKTEDRVFETDGEQTLLTIPVSGTKEVVIEACR